VLITTHTKYYDGKLQTYSVFSARM